jgi:peptide/nickel transport system permease protein
MKLPIQTIINVTKRIAIYLAAFFVAITVNFILPRLMPGSALITLLSMLQGAIGEYGANSALVSAEIKQIEEAFGLTPQPWYIQYVDYIKGIFTGNLGASITFYPTNVAKIVFPSMIWSMGLVVVSSIVAFFLGSWLGSIAAIKRRSVTDTVIVVVISILATIPAFVIIMYLEMGFSVNLKIVELTFPNIKSMNLKTFLSLLNFYSVPVAGMVLSLLSGFVLGMRNNMLHTLRDNYVYYAELLGLSENTIRKIVYRNSILPNITGITLIIGLAISAALTVEGLLTIPGAGYFFGLSLTSRDLPLIQGYFLVIVVLLLVSIAIAEILYGLLDPRARGGAS